MMNPPVLGLLLGIGLVLIASSVMIPRAQEGQEPLRVPRARGRRLVSLVAPVMMALSAAGLFWWVFRIPVLAVAALAAVLAPAVMRRRAVEDTTARQVGETASTVARWVEGVRDYMLTATTLQDALVRASLDVRGPHARDFERFAATLNGAGGFAAAAQDLADELHNALADKALTALWIGSREGGDMHGALSLLADSAQLEADNARRIEAGLAGTRRLVRIVSLLCLCIFVLALFAFRENFVVYRSVGGQVLLAVGLGVIGACWWGIWRMSKIEGPERLVSVRPMSGRAQLW